MRTSTAPVGAALVAAHSSYADASATAILGRVRQAPRACPYTEILCHNNVPHADLHRSCRGSPCGCPFRVCSTSTPQRFWDVCDKPQELAPRRRSCGITRSLVRTSTGPVGAALVAAHSAYVDASATAIPGRVRQASRACPYTEILCHNKVPRADLHRSCRGSPCGCPFRVCGRQRDSDPGMCETSPKSLPLHGDLVA